MEGDPSATLVQLWVLLAGGLWQELEDEAKSPIGLVTSALSEVRSLNRIVTSVLHGVCTVADAGKTVCIEGIFDVFS